MKKSFLTLQCKISALFMQKFRQIQLKIHGFLQVQVNFIDWGKCETVRAEEMYRASDVDANLNKIPPQVRSNISLS